MEALTTKNKKGYAVTYARVSTDEQTLGLSLDTQDAVCLEKLKQDGYELLEQIRDEGISAGTLHRPGIKKVMDLVIAEKISALYSVASDRLCRNTYDHLFFRDLLMKHNVKRVYINQPNMDDSAISLTMDTVLASMNEMQRLMTSEKVKDTLYKKAKEGYFPGSAPLGYRNILNPNSASRFAQHIMIPDETIAPFVTEAFETYATGLHTVPALNEQLFQKGLRSKTGKKFSDNQFYNMLKNPTYTGAINWGTIHIGNGKHQPLIDRETFATVQGVLTRHNKFACRRRKYSWLLNGFIYCASHNRRYTAEWHLPKKIAYYHCPTPSTCGRYIRTEELEDAVAEKFKDIQFSREFTDRVIHEVKKIFYERRKNYDAKRQVLVNQQTAFNARMKTAEDRLLDKVISPDEFTRMKEEIKKELSSIEERLFELEGTHDTHVDIAQEILRFTENIYSTYKKAPPALKRHYLAFFWERFEIADKVIIASYPTLLFRELLALEHASLKNQKLEKTSDNSEVIISSRMLPLLDRFRTIDWREIRQALEFSGILRFASITF